MPLLRRLCVLASVVAGSALLASPAFATAPDPAATTTLGTTHFLVHFSTDLHNSFAITASQASDAAGMAERALSAELADGYPMPQSDGGLGGDNRIDIYVQDIGQFGEAGEADPDNAGPASGYIILDAISGAESYHVIAHELFHLIQFGYWVTGDPTDMWLYEGSAEWMGYRADGYGTSGGTQPIAVGHNDFSLDCRDPAPDGILCAPDVYYDNGYSRWPFFEFLTEKYGSSFVKDIFTQVGAQGDGSALASVTTALGAKGATLADTYNAWTAAELTGSYTAPALQGLAPTIYGSPIETGSKVGFTMTQHVPLNHLSMRFLEFDRGANDLTSECFAATLSVTVTIPAGTSSKPVFWWNEKGNAPIPLSVNGNTAVAAIPWDTCTWQANRGFLAIPNASTNVDGADFVVSASMSVDFSTPASATPPPTPAAVNTPVVAVPTANDYAPETQILGSEILRLSAGDTTLRLIVQSNAEGKLHASLGGVDLGSPTIRAGSNDVRLTLPKGTLNALRRTAAQNILTLTTISPLGTRTGATVTRRVEVAPGAKKPKHPAKKKPKKHS
jgi:hypothetical protein